MPRFVVPRALWPRNRCVTFSSSRWYGMIRCALPEIRSFETSMPASVSSSISARSTPGSTTTPSAITLVMCGYRMPLGTRWSLSSRPSAMIVWPALLPP